MIRNNLTFTITDEYGLACGQFDVPHERVARHFDQYREDWPENHIFQGGFAERTVFVNTVASIVLGLGREEE